ncbi:MAG: hypothetical protein HYX56_04230 [Chloroflexi bacterium]|nr:hypothetical protein [Chloroflexota bacterium]
MAGLTRRIAVAAVAAAIVSTSCGFSPFGCGASGGTADVDAQLRFIDANDGQIVFTFGPSSRSNSFGVPAYALERTSTAGGVETLRLTLRGGWMRNPDGTPSYGGPTQIDVKGEHVVDVALDSDQERATTWTATAKGKCPRVSSKTYVYGKSPRAQVALTFGGMSAFTLGSTSDLEGAPQDTPVQASGMGFAPNATIVISALGTRLWDTTSDGTGRFDSGFNIGYPPPGTYTVIASDGQGHRGATQLKVILPTNPFRQRP